MQRILKIHRLFSRSFVVLAMAGLAIMLTAPAASARGGGAGMNIGLGLGAHIPVEDEAYGDLGVDLYPELQLMFDIAGVRFGPSVGYVYRKVEVSRWVRNRYYYEEYEMSFQPTKFNIAILPIRFANRRFIFHPYIGFGAGSYIATGDNDEDLAMVSVSGGFELRFSDWYNLSFDFTYNDVDEPSSSYDGIFSLGGADLSYSTVMLVNRLRFPFWRRNRW